MPIDFKQVKKQFEKSMSEYDANATVQNMMASKMLFELLKIRTSFDRVLELGSGTGILTKQLAKSITYNSYFANDLVEKSKIYVSKYLPNVNFICGNATKIKPDKKVDLVISNAMFQWFENIEKLIQVIKTYMVKGGILAFSTFSPKNYTELTAISGLALKYKTKEEIREILEILGFEVLYCEEFYETLKFKSPLEVLVHMKKTGVNSISEKVWSVKKVKEFCDKYSRKYPDNTLTYAPIIVIAKLV